MDIYDDYLKGKNLDELLNEARAEQDKDKSAEYSPVQQRSLDYALVQVPKDNVIDKKKEIEADFPYLDQKLIGTKFGRKMIELYEKDKSLQNILNSDFIPELYCDVTERFIIGRALFTRCCGERVIKIQEICYDEDWQDVKTFFSFSKSSRLIYCPSCAKAIKYTSIFG